MVYGGMKLLSLVSRWRCSVVGALRPVTIAVMGYIGESLPQIAKHPGLLPQLAKIKSCKVNEIYYV